MNQKKRFQLPPLLKQLVVQKTNNKDLFVRLEKTNKQCACQVQLHCKCNFTCKCGNDSNPEDCFCSKKLKCKCVIPSNCMCPRSCWSCQTYPEWKNKKPICCSKQNLKPCQACFRSCYNSHPFLYADMVSSNPKLLYNLFGNVDLEMFNNFLNLNPLPAGLGYRPLHKYEVNEKGKDIIRDLSDNIVHHVYLDLDYKDTIKFAPKEEDHLIYLPSPYYFVERVHNLLHAWGVPTEFLNCIITSKSTEKSGFHLHYPEVFLSHKDYITLSQELTKFGFDDVSSKYWRFHQSPKELNTPAYEVSLILDCCFHPIDQEEYRNRFTYPSNLNNYNWRKILSPFCFPTDRPINHYKVEAPKIQEIIEVKSVKQKFNTEEFELSPEYIQQLEEMLGSVILKQNSDHIEVRNNGGLNCPVCDREHESQNGKIYSRHKKLYYFCFRNNSSTELNLKI